LNAYQGCADFPHPRYLPDRVQTHAPRAQGRGDYSVRWHILPDWTTLINLSALKLKFCDPSRIARVVLGKYSHISDHGTWSKCGGGARDSLFEVRGLTLIAYAGRQSQWSLVD
jgi:hypothetical protein